MQLHALTNEETIGWLLEKENPSVRYFALTRLLGMPEEDTDVAEARRDIMATGPVPAIMALQQSEGCWGDPRRYYLNKYTGTAWQLLILAELGADGRDQGVRKAGEFILQNAQDRQSFGFAVHIGAQGGGRHNEVIPCLTGNMLYSLIRLGMLEDAPRSARHRMACALSARRRRRGKTRQRVGRMTAWRPVSVGTPATWAQPRRSRRCPPSTRTSAARP